MSLAVVRDLRPQSRLSTAEDVAAFEQDLLAEFVMARASAGVTDGTIRTDVSIVVELREWFLRPLWQMQPQDLDRFFGRHQRELAAGTKTRKAAAIGVFFEFLELRHKPEIHAATGWVVESPLDEVNRPRGGRTRGCASHRRRRRSTCCSLAGGRTWPGRASMRRWHATTPQRGCPA